MAEAPASGVYWGVGMAMKSRQDGMGRVRLWMRSLFVPTAVALCAASVATAAERQFLVTLAHPPKESRFLCVDDDDCRDRGTGFVCGTANVGRPVCVVPCTTDEDCGTFGPIVSCNPTLRICDFPRPNPELVRRQYFDRDDPGIGSFAEYWKEISYGDVTVAGRVTDWILLPWPITAPFVFTDLNGDFFLSYGAGENFTSPPILREQTMVGVDIGGEITDPTYARGAEQVTTTGVPVWTPGERFMDMNGDGVWNGFDEATNTMDWRKNGFPLRPADDLPDLRGPWIDLNGNGIPDNESNCVFLADSDNDGVLDLDEDQRPDDKPDCCPNGRGLPGCQGLVTPGPDESDEACPASTWTLPGGNTITDCNGNLIDDAIDLENPNLDRLPFAVGASNRCELAPDGILDACQFEELGGGYPSTPCSGSAPACTDPDNLDPCCSVAPIACTIAPRVPRPRCEFHDANGNGELDTVEPFENYFAGIPGGAGYVRHNFPGSNPNAVIARSGTRSIGAPHDPLGKLTSSRDRVCADGLPYRTIGSQTAVCPAGTHAEYNPPDAWIDLTPLDPPVAPAPLLVGSSKMLVRGGATTPEPEWYKQAWRERYNNAVPPPWDISVGVSLLEPRSPASGNEFLPNRGGLNGDGTGWPTDPPDEVFVLPDQLLQAISDEAPLMFYDGPTEYDDLPSSKYHRAGDQFVGEITSPFSYSIAGDDRGTNNPSVPGVPDGVIPAAGPYATRLHGQNGRDGGNQLNIEVLTWRTAPPTNDGRAWEGNYGFHPYAGSSNQNFGFRDYNLDGRLDLGEARTFDSISYTSQGGGGRDRIIEDCIEILDETLDFDSYVDPVALEAVACHHPGVLTVDLPPPYEADGSIPVAGLASGIVLLPPGTPSFGFPTTPDFLPIHNEDGFGDSVFLASNFPKPPATSRLSWNIRFHNLVQTLGSADFNTAFAAENYGQAWQNWPDLEDYDSRDGSGIVNCPIGAWDIMTDEGGLVHPIAPLKEGPCTEWIKTVDLTAVLTPGVDKSLTFPAAEFVRDDSYYVLENEDRPREKLYFWSAGSGFDERMPGGGLLIVHADPAESNIEAIALQQRSGLRPAYRIIQADGLRELEGGPGVDLVCGDAGDPFPGATDQTSFGCSTLPASQWYTDDACTGLEILEVLPDGAGATRVTFNWTPTSIPSLRFVDPPGGVTVGTLYQIRTEANDVYGGTSIRFYYKKQDLGTPDFSGSTFIAPQKRKTTSGPNDLSISWDVSGLPDGRYFIFADLIPGQGSDGTEAKLTRPRAGRNNQGAAKLEVGDVVVNVTTVSNGTVTSQGKARSETWVAECVDASAGKWFVSSSLTQSPPAEEPSAALCTATPARCATTGAQYTSLSDAVKFTIRAGTGPSPKGALGDTFTFTTTGITAPSEAVTIRNGQIREDPTAVIDATPLSGLPPLTVRFDARGSVDPNGQPLQFRWTFGDVPEQATGAQVQHTYAVAGTFTVTLRATNPSNARFGEASVDIQVINNSPSAVIRATPSSGPAPLAVRFSGGQSSDAETTPERLVYQWIFGDGGSANDEGRLGVLREVDHTYSRKADGTLCTTAAPCEFKAKLTVTDEGGKTDAEELTIRVGNSNPVANISTTSLTGGTPLTVTFNAKNSTDAENDKLEVEWQWGDGSANETFAAKTGKSPSTTGEVPHTFTLPANTASKTYTVKAIVRDLNASGARKGGETTWPGVTVTVTQASAGESDPRAIFCFVSGAECVNTSPSLIEGQSFTADGSRSFDVPSGGRISAYSWEWGDATALGSGAVATHAYAAGGRYTITLTVSDGDTPAHTGRTQKTVVVTREGGEPPPVSNRPPVPAFEITPPDGFVDAVFSFDARGSTDPDGDDLSFRWSFGDGASTQFGTNPRTTHKYSQTGMFVVRLSVRDEHNATVDSTHTVRVLLEGTNRSPVAVIGTGPRSGAAPLTLTFDGRLSSDPDADTLTYVWEFRVGEELIATLAGGVVTRVFADPGSYTVTLVVSDGVGGETRSQAQNILVTEPGEAPPEPPTPRPGPTEPPDSSSQRPTPRVCGMGMLTALFGSLVGLVGTVVMRRRMDVR